MIAVAALIALDHTRAPPELTALPMGRAALRLLDEGIVVVLGDRAHRGCVSGYAASRDGWVPVDNMPVCGVYDRFARLRAPQQHAALLAALKDVPLGNPLSLRVLSADKLASQHHLTERGVKMPPLCSDPDDFDRALQRWGVAFAKPRFGAQGHGVVRVVPGDTVAHTVLNAEQQPEPVLLQRAVTPPPDWAGVSVRTLVHRTAEDRWLCSPSIARRSRHDPVVNVDRGAEAAAACDVLPADTVAQLSADAIACATALSDYPDGQHLLEVGVDAMVDDRGVGWVIEVNTRPWGRLATLFAQDPQRWGQAHIEACARPFRFLAGRAAHSR